MHVSYRPLFCAMLMYKVLSHESDYVVFVSTIIVLTI